MKKLTLRHVIKTAKIVKAAGLKNKLADIAAKSEGDTTRIGAEIIMTAFEACADDEVEKQLYDLLDDVFEAKTENMTLDKVIENFKELAKENNLTSFFKSALKS